VLGCRGASDHLKSREGFHLRLHVILGDRRQVFQPVLKAFYRQALGVSLGLCLAPSGKRAVGGIRTFAYTVKYPIPSAGKLGRGSLPNSGSNLKNQPEDIVRTSPGKIAARYKMGLPDAYR
jgi:hypothetical protein